MAHYLYNPAKVQVSWWNGGNATRLTGFSSGSFVTVDIDSPEVIVRKGIDGGNSVLPKFDSSGTVTLSFQQGSLGNVWLQEIAAHQEQNPGEISQGSITIDDASGTFNLKIDDVIIQSQPNVSFGKLASEGTREWVLYSNRISYNRHIQLPQTSQSTVRQLLTSLTSLP